MEQHPISTLAPAWPCGVHSERFHDFDRFSRIYSDKEWRIEQLSAGRFEGSSVIVRGELVQAARVDFNQVLLARGRAAPGRFAVCPVLPRNAGGLWRGRRLDPGQMVLLGPEGESDHRSARRVTVIELSLPAEALARHARALLKADEVRVPRTWSAVAPPPAVSERFQRALGRLLGLGFVSVQERREAEERCLRALLAIVFGASVGPARGDLPSRGRIAVVRRAEELMRSRLDRSTGAIDLCMELDVSDRTLRRAFLERWGMGPIAFHRTLRLNAVRAALKADAPSVSEVARKWGFQHLGNFAADYRRAFGEPPSRTARQSRAS